MSSPWPVTQRDRAAFADAAETLTPDAQPDSADVEAGIPDANFELFSDTRTS
jgi:hypothetical protein